MVNPDTGPIRNLRGNSNGRPTQPLDPVPAAPKSAEERLAEIRKDRASGEAGRLAQRGAERSNYGDSVANSSSFEINTTSFDDEARDRSISQVDKGVARTAQDCVDERVLAAMEAGEELSEEQRQEIYAAAQTEAEGAVAGVIKDAIAYDKLGQEIRQLHERVNGRNKPTAIVLPGGGELSFTQIGAARMKQLEDALIAKVEADSQAHAHLTLSELRYMGRASSESLSSEAKERRRLELATELAQITSFEGDSRKNPLIAQLLDQISEEERNLREFIEPSFEEIKDKRSEIAKEMLELRAAIKESKAANDQEADRLSREMGSITEKIESLKAQRQELERQKAAEKAKLEAEIIEQELEYRDSKKAHREYYNANPTDDLPHDQTLEIFETLDKLEKKIKSKGTKLQNTQMRLSLVDSKYQSSSSDRRGIEDLDSEIKALENSHDELLAQRAALAEGPDAKRIKESQERIAKLSFEGSVLRSHRGTIQDISRQIETELSGLRVQRDAMLTEVKSELDEMRARAEKELESLEEASVSTGVRSAAVRALTWARGLFSRREASK